MKGIHIIVAGIAAACFCCSAFGQSVEDRWLTKAEHTEFRETARYDETMAFCRQLEKASKAVKVTSFGKSAEGRDLPLVILSEQRIFDPKKAAASGKAIILIQNGIHAGEIDGKDASLMLLRDVVVARKFPEILDNVILLVIPIYNVDGHERFGPYNRINQNGPVEMGWRVTAQNLNLNRDYMKADAPETQAWLRLFNQWLPDLVVDCHVTDGADYQYSVTYSVEKHENLHPAVRRWQEEKLVRRVIANVEAAGHRMSQYIWLRDDKDPTRGLIGGVASPRLSTPYAAAQNRPGFLIETHMLKDYRTRVDATLRVLWSIIEVVGDDVKALRRTVRIADEQTRQGLENPFPLRFEATEKSTPFKFDGYQFEIRRSEISGADYVAYTKDPFSIEIPFYDNVRVATSVVPPRAYLIPQTWKNVIDRLALHGIAIQRLKSPAEVDVELYRFTNPRWQQTPYEGRHPVTYSVEKFQEKRIYPAGTIVIPLNQRAAKVAVFLLEPESPDAFAAWGFFDAVFEQKEYAEEYVMEKLAREMIRDNPSLKEEFETLLKSDSSFAASPNARLNFFYRRSPYWDKQMGVYPVARIVTDAALPTEQYNPKTVQP